MIPEHRAGLNQLLTILFASTPIRNIAEDDATDRVLLVEPEL
jgi:hypothetical protein